MKKFAWSLLFFLSCIHAAASDLPEELATAVQKAGFDRKGIGLYVQEVDAAQPLVSFQAETPFNPASVIKLVTTAAALAQLGPGYRWSTDVYHTGKIRDGKLNGNLYFRGNGDPYLTPERFWLLLNRVSIYGIKEIAGEVVVDSTYFQPEEIDYAAFDDQPYRSYNVGPNAVLVGFQATEFHFAVDGNGKDQKVQITPFPASPRLRIVNNIEPVNGGCGAWEKRLTLNTTYVDDALQVDFGGRYARDCGKRVLYRRVTGAQDHFQHFFVPLWQQLGGTYDGKVVSGTLPGDATLIHRESSISLAEAVRLINKFSNNVMTRQVVLSLGAQAFGPPGTTQKGITTIEAWLKAQNLYDPTLQLDNGSGLSRNSRISAALLGRLLVHSYHQAYMPEFIASLPVAGYDGSMAHRFNGAPLLGRAHIKTGLLDFVQSMAGYIDGADGKRYVVVMLHNDARAHTKAAERLQNEIIQWIYSYSPICGT